MYRVAEDGRALLEAAQQVHAERHGAHTFLPGTCLSFLEAAKRTGIRSDRQRSGLVLHGRLHVAVDAEHHAQTRMSQSILDDLGVDVLPCQQRGARVPQVVEADIGETGAPQEGLEVAVHYVLGVQRRALTCGGYEP
jgi:hypothetical protein